MSKHPTIRIPVKGETKKRLALIAQYFGVPATTWRGIAETAIALLAHMIEDRKRRELEDED